MPSKHGNCISFETDESPPIFTLKWSKNRSPVHENSPDEEDDSFIITDLITPSNSENKENILGYIGGYIVRKLVKHLDCRECCDAMLSNNSTKHRFLSLVALKDRGGLVYPSDGILKVVNMAERIFKQFVCGISPNEMKINNTRNLQAKLVNKVVAELSRSSIFSNLQRHDIDNFNITEDFHSTQIIKAVATKFFVLRLSRYGQEYTRNVLKKDIIGKRQQLNKLILFQGL